MSDRGHFTIARVSDGEDGLVLRVRGELDLHTVPELRDALNAAKADYLAVMLDLSEVDFMDSTGLSLLIRGITDAAADGWSLEVGAVSEAVRALLERTGLSELHRKHSRDAGAPD